MPFDADFVYILRHKENNRQINLHNLLAFDGLPFIIIYSTDSVYNNILYNDIQIV